MPIRLSSTRLDLGSANLTNAEMRAWSETVNALGNVTGATTIDLSLGNVVTATTTGATTWTVTNASSTQASSFTLILSNGGSQTQTWMSGTQWSQGVAPTLNSSGTDVLTFFTTDAGATWRGAKGGPTPADQVGQKLFVWGSSSFGRLGLGDTIARSSPIQLSGQWRISLIGNPGAFGIRPNGSAYVWGNKNALGIGDTTHARSSPVQLAGTWSSIGRAYYGGVFFRAGGQLFTWSDAHISYSPLSGHGDVVRRSSPVQVAGTWTEATMLRFWSTGLRSDGSLWTWGKNGRGQLGIGSNDGTLIHSSPVQVPGTWIQLASTTTSAHYTNGAIKSDGSLWMWGDGKQGQTGDGITVYRSSPVQVAGTWKKVVVGGVHTMGLRADGTLWVWGDNSSGALGLGDTIARSSPVQVGSGVWRDISGGSGTFTALNAQGQLFVQGSSTSGRLGLGDTITRSSPVQLAGTWLAIDAGGTNTMTGFKL